VWDWLEYQTRPLTQENWYDSLLSDLFTLIQKTTQINIMYIFIFILFIVLVICKFSYLICKIKLDQFYFALFVLYFLRETFLKILSSQQQVVSIC